MRSHASWSIGLGRWGGVHVRLHMFFLLFALITLLLSWQASERLAGAGEQDPYSMMKLVAGSLAILLVSVLLHEAGHYAAALRLGGGGDEIVLGPLGGLSPMRPPYEPYGECLMHLAGPLVNLAVCLASAAVLFALQVDIWGLLRPLSPQGLEPQDPLVCFFKLTFWINWLLALVNVTPAFPFDGGRALRAALMGFWPDASPARASHIVTNVAKVVSVVLLVLAWAWFDDSDATRILPLWFCLVMLAILLFFSARHEEERMSAIREDEHALGYDFSQGYTSLESTASHRADAGGSLWRWLQRRRQDRLRRLREIEVEEERRVDDILLRLHEGGIESLSDDERALLQRVSHRYRQRNSQQSP